MHYSKLHTYISFFSFNSNLNCSLRSVCSLNSNSKSIEIPEFQDTVNSILNGRQPFYCQAFNKHQALGRFEKSASCLKGSLTQQVLCLFNSSMLLHTLFGILHVSSSAHKSWFFLEFDVQKCNRSKVLWKGRHFCCFMVQFYYLM